MWQDYQAIAEENHTVVGQVRILRDVYSPQLANQRDVVVYLPPSYTLSRKSYPVIYMHDGQNLFDASTSFVGEWEVDETMEVLAEEGLEAIIVGIYNTGKQRIYEYNPFLDVRFGQGRGADYLRFITETLKPRIDTDFRTLPDRANTGIAGSSMGGLISLYGFFHFGEVFGLAGVMSPSLWLARAAALQDVADAPYVDGKLYLDIGTREMSPRQNAVAAHYAGKTYCGSARCLRDLLHAKGYTDATLKYVEEVGGAHQEAAWARRLPDALRFLLR